MAMAFVEGLGWVEKQTKAVDITENGTTEITPDRGMVLNSVMVNTNVPQNDINLDDYVKKDTSNGRGVYGKNNGVEIFFKLNYANSADVNGIPFRATNGAIMIPDGAMIDCGAITPGLQAVNKNYVDKLVADLAARIEALEKKLRAKITFEVESFGEYEAVEGMTWAEWCVSAHNTDGWYVNDYGDVTNGVSYIKLNGVNVNSSDTIINAGRYTPW